MDEASLVRKIKKAVEAEGAYAAKIHGGRYSAGVPDLLVCYEGDFFAFEVKLPKGKHKLSKLQESNLNAINEADGVGLMITSVAEALEALRTQGSS